MPPDHTAQPSIPRWLPDAASSFPARLWRSAALIPRLWRPGRFWRSVSAGAPVSLSALGAFLLVVLLTRLLMGAAGALDDLAFTASPPTAPGFTSDAPTLAREIAYPSFASKTSDDGVLDPSWLAAPLAAHTAFLLLLLALTKDRRRAGVTALCVLRAWTYGFAWLAWLFLVCALAGALDSVAYARLVYSGFTIEQSTLDSISAFLVRATESPVLLAIIGVWILLWWRGAIVTAWKVPRGQAGWALISLVAIVVGAAAVLLTQHIQTLRVIAEG